ncbi:LysR family transcriptional regulator [Pseudoalteromonas sp. NBT06-2]|uniref:LysR substrate-binding domain-containing protein n=1 Tax=Pseudoalteromonas sp. NBT06-2 TaxID=2025950 RepID=UPI000BA7DF48|nr:LysR substrate-binding domain-containing protein [Pseudoalteromonas sp. NBT06-2]PAJ71948.1 LysR family transcriptional regulator [Pseudoalteromonas sp. NBT06-2]
MNIVLKQLNIFKLVAQEKSITAAAKKLFLTKPAVSMALNELEKQLGHQLFDRYNNRLLINEFGLKLQPLADELLARTQDISTLFDEKSKLTGQLKIGASDTIGNQVVPFLLKDFRLETQHTQQRLTISNSTDIYEKLTKFELDIALVEGKINHDNLAITSWLSDEMCIVCSPDSPLANTTIKQITDLENQDWIFREEGSGTKHYFMHFLEPKLKSWHMAFQLTNTEAIINSVAAGLGIACLSKIAVIHAVKDKRLTMLPLPKNQIRQYYLVHHKQKYISPLLQSFIEFSLSWRTELKVFAKGLN